MHGFFSPKYGIRRLKAIVLKWLLRDCLLYIANLWNSMFQVPLLPNMTHWAVYHFFCNVSEREKCWMGYSRKNPHTPLMEGIFLDPLPFPSTWISKTAWATPPPPLQDFQFQRPPPPPPIWISIKLSDTAILIYKNLNSAWILCLLWRKLILFSYLLKEASHFANKPTFEWTSLFSRSGKIYGNVYNITAQNYDYVFE